LDPNCQYKTSLVLVGSLACIVVFFLIPFRYLGLACVACLFSAALALRGSQSAASPLPVEDSTVGRVLRLLDTLPTDEDAEHKTAFMGKKAFLKCFGVLRQNHLLL
jgi:hypothetical protein